MPLPPPLAPEAQHVFRLARDDLAAARRALEELPVEAQLALVCETPLARRSELLSLLPEPERVIPLLPEAELCFTVKAIGLADAPWILEHATPAQIVACVDLDGWSGTLPDRASIDAWIDALAETPGSSFLRSLRALDPEIAVLYLKNRIAVFLKPSDDDWQPPDGAQTLDGQFYLVALRDGDDLASILTMLHGLFECDYWTYFRLLQGVIWELDSENEEWALRWRSGRLEDLGFPPWDEAMRIYEFVRPEERAAIAPDDRPLDLGAWRLPVWMPRLPSARDARHAIFRAIEALRDDERTACFYAFVAVANKLAVADRLPLGDAESTPLAIEKVARFASVGLEYLAREHDLAPADVLRRVSIERLFRVGANLEPGAARPPAPDSTQKGPVGEAAGPFE